MLSSANEPHLAILRDRAEMFAHVRRFFSERGVMEVDTPLLSRLASVDEMIDLIPCTYNGTEKRYLHSSPEYGMKRLLCKGIGDIFQMSHVFRNGELGERHSPEFMMVEWYRVGASFLELIEETLDLCRLFLGQLPSKQISYREAIRQYAGIDCFEATTAQLVQCLEKHRIPLYSTLDREDRDELLNLLLATLVEPFLGRDGLTVLCYYPASQAALAQTVDQGGHRVAERYEIYFQGYELCNGYHELGDGSEQGRRLDAANLARQSMGKEVLPPDTRFLEALKNEGLPDCCGVAVGFDRLMMLRHGVAQISRATPFSWQEA